MRDDGENFTLLNTAASKEPRVTIKISFDDDDTDLLYLTSHSDAGYPVGADVVTDCVKDLSSATQRIRPLNATSEIGVITFKVVDTSGDVTAWINTKLDAGTGLRRRKCVFFLGYVDLAWVDYQIIHTYLLDTPTYKDGEYTFKTTDIQRSMRQDVFDGNTLYLTADITATATQIPVTGSDLYKFQLYPHDAVCSIDISEYIGYVKIEDEIISHNGMEDDVSLGTVINVVERGAFNTAAAGHEKGTATNEDRNTAVDEHIFIEGPAPRLMYAVLTGLHYDGLNSTSDDQFDLTTWTAGATVTESTASTPTGWGKAYLVEDDNDAAYEIIYTISTDDYTHGEKWTASFFIRKQVAVTDVLVRLEFTGGVAASYCDINVNTGTGSVTTNSVNATISSNDGIEFDDNWYYLRISGYSTTTGTTNSRILLYPAVSGVSDIGSIIAFGGALIRGETSGMSVLPRHWHLGINESWTVLNNFTGIGPDLWDTDNESGTRLSFQALTKTDGKKYIEKEMALWSAVFMPVLANGALGLKRLVPVLAGASEIRVLNNSNVVSYGDLRYDFNSIMNNSSVEWNWNDTTGAYTKKNLFIDQLSIDTHGAAALKTLEFRGVHTRSGTEEALANQFDSLRDRFAGPPMTIPVSVAPSLNGFEVGDIVRLELDQIRDYVTDTTINRAFEIQQVMLNWLTGSVDLKLFASSFKAGEISRTTTTDVLDDTFYVNGTLLSSVVTISADVMTADGSLPGAATMAAGIYYHLGNLTINSGVTLTVNDNVQLRIRGTLTINGTINGKGNGGAAGTGSTAKPSNSTSGEAKAFGATLASGGVDSDTGFFATASLTWYTLYSDRPLPRFVEGDMLAIPDYNLINNSTSIDGLPTSHIGCGGSGGEAAYNHSGVVVGVGGAGGAGGAGLIIICRGAGWGGAGEINLSGDDGSLGTSGTVGFGTVYAGSGAGGSPGACFVLIDGNHSPFDLHLHLTANRGACVIQAQQLTELSAFYIQSGDPQPSPLSSYYAGYQVLDQSEAVGKVKYLSNVIAAEPDITPSYTVPALASITTTSVSQHIINDDGSIVYRIKTTWTASTDPQGRGYEIQAKLSSEASSEWQTVLLSNELTQNVAYVIVSAVTNYDVRMRVLAIDPAIDSAWTTNSTIASGAKVTLPANVTGVTAVKDHTQILIKWNAVAEDDISYYIVKKGTVWASGTDTIETDGTVHRYSITTVGLQSFMVKAVDTSGNESVAAGTGSLSVPLTNATGLTLTSTATEELESTTGTTQTRIKIGWTASVDTNVDGYEIRWMTVGGSDYTYEQRITGRTTVQSYINVIPNFNYQVEIRAYSDLGLYSSWNTNTRIAIGSAVIGKDFNLRGTDSIVGDYYFYHMQSDALDNLFSGAATTVDSNAGAIKLAPASNTQEALYKYSFHSVSAQLDWSKVRAVKTHLYQQVDTPLSGSFLFVGIGFGSSVIMVEFDWDTGTSKWNLTGFMNKAGTSVQTATLASYTTVEMRSLDIEIVTDPDNSEATILVNGTEHTFGSATYFPTVNDEGPLYILFKPVYSSGTNEMFVQDWLFLQDL